MYTNRPPIQPPTISIIAALAENNKAIGKDNKLLWHLPEDLARFKKLTSGHPIIMGRKTYESIGKPLPNRTNIVVSRNPNLSIGGCIVVPSLEKAIIKASELDKNEIFIIGGEQIYKKGVDIAHRLYLTLVQGDFEGDTFFPNYSHFQHILHKENRFEKGYTYTFVTLARE